MTTSPSSGKLRVASVVQMQFLGQVKQRQLLRAIMLTMFVSLWMLMQQNTAQAAGYQDFRHNMGDFDGEAGAISRYLKTAHQEGEAGKIDGSDVQQPAYIMIVVRRPAEPTTIAAVRASDAPSSVYPLYFD